jgi:hypothetical protein
MHYENLSKEDSNMIERKRSDCNLVTIFVFEFGPGDVLGVNNSFGWESGRHTFNWNNGKNGFLKDHAQGHSEWVGLAPNREKSSPRIQPLIFS